MHTYFQVYDMTYLHGTVKRQNPANDNKPPAAGVCVCVRVRVRVCVYRERVREKRLYVCICRERERELLERISLSEIGEREQVGW
jgi:hypothetical protein